MKRLIYIFAALVALSSCTISEGGNSDQNLVAKMAASMAISEVQQQIHILSYAQTIDYYSQSGDGEREIITCYIDNKIAAVAILKKDTEERKISTLFVKPEYQKRGIATELLEKCFAWLETTRPVITIADYKLDQFAKVIEKYGWTETEVLADGYYNDHSREHVFNG